MFPPPWGQKVSPAWLQISEPMPSCLRPKDSLRDSRHLTNRLEDNTWPITRSEPWIFGKSFAVGTVGKASGRLPGALAMIAKLFGVTHVWQLHSDSRQVKLFHQRKIWFVCCRVRSQISDARLRPR